MVILTVAITLISLLRLYDYDYEYGNMSISISMTNNEALQLTNLN